MLILDKPHKFNRKSIRIPLYHRGHLSIFAGAKVWACLFPEDKNQDILPELVLSPIAFQHWDDIWRMSFLFWERVGLVHDVLKILKDLNINVVTLESSSLNRQKHYLVDIIADVRDYSNVKDLSYSARLSEDKHRLLDLENLFFLLMEKDIFMNSKGNPSIKISRVRALFDYRCEASKPIHNGDNNRLIFQDLLVKRFKENGVQINFPKNFLKKLDGFGWHLMVSDTKYRYAKIVFFKEQNKFINPTLTFKERVGALAEISHIIQKYNFNILASLSRLYKFGEKAQAEFVLQVPDEYNQLSTKEIQIILEEKLATETLIEEYEIEIDYRKFFRFDSKTKPIKQILSKDSTSVSYYDT